MPDLSRMLCSGVFADVRIHAGREQEPVLINSLLLAALGGPVVSLMEENNKGDDGYWDIIIPEAIFQDLEAAFLDLMTWVPGRESVVLLEEMALLRKGFVMEEDFDIVKVEHPEEQAVNYDGFECKVTEESPSNFSINKGG